MECGGEAIMSVHWGQVAKLLFSTPGRDYDPEEGIVSDGTPPLPHSAGSVAVLAAAPTLHDNHFERNPGWVW
jgi:hypothetical protein